MATPITIVSADRGYDKQGKDPETALRLNDRPSADWIRLLIQSYATIATRRNRQISVSGDRLIIHAKIEEVAEHLLPPLEAAVDLANRGYATLNEGRPSRTALGEGGAGTSISSAFDAIDDAIASRRP